MTPKRQQIVEIIGPVSEETLNEVESVTPNREELLQAAAWVRNEADGLLSPDRPTPAGRVGLLVQILSRCDGDPFTRDPQG